MSDACDIQWFIFLSAYPSTLRLSSGSGSYTSRSAGAAPAVTQRRAWPVAPRVSVSLSGHRTPHSADRTDDEAPKNTRAFSHNPYAPSLLELMPDRGHSRLADGPVRVPHAHRAGVTPAWGVQGRPLSATAVPAPQREAQQASRRVDAVAGATRTCQRAQSDQRQLARDRRRDRADRPRWPG
jgi:hypothetical protein